MIRDIVERPTEKAGAQPPGLKTKAPSLWKQRQAAKKKPTNTAPPPAIPVAKSVGDAAAQHTQGSTQEPLSEQEKIHLENLQKLSKMDAKDIEAEKQELMNTLDPNVLTALLKRAEIKEQEFSRKEPAQAAKDRSAPASPKASKQSQPLPSKVPAQETETPRASAEQVSPDEREPGSGMHFPLPTVPDDLHKYFPDTPLETSKLAWMQPVDEAEELEYSEELASVAPSQLRFDFNGNILTPRMSNAIDSTVGLHHHADAPGAAGYTIPELAHLARSSHASQRSIAIRTLGRVLHKLVNGHFNKSSDLQYALEKLVKYHRVEETLLEAASDQTRSLTVRTHATEALWLYHNRTDKAQEASEHAS